MEKLFAVYVGGMVEGCHVELHDMRFVIGATIEDCFDDLKAQWWGTPESLHLDAWGPLDWVDGFRVEVGGAPARADAPSERLWFLNMGGYDAGQFTELHDNRFIVARDPRAAKKKALIHVADWTSPHKDAVMEIEHVVDVAVAASGGSVIWLTPDPTPRPFRFEARYVPIGRMA